MRRVEGGKNSTKVNKENSYIKCDVYFDLNYNRKEFQILGHFNTTANFFFFYKGIGTLRKNINVSILTHNQGCTGILLIKGNYEKDVLNSIASSVYSFFTCLEKDLLLVL